MPNVVRKKVSKPTGWRVGKKVPINVYGPPTKEWPKGRPVCQCHNAEDARLIVSAVNSMRVAEAKP